MRTPCRTCATRSSTGSCPRSSLDIAPAERLLTTEEGRQWPEFIAPRVSHKTSDFRDGQRSLLPPPSWRDMGRKSGRVRGGYLRHPLTLTKSSRWRLVERRLSKSCRSAAIVGHAGGETRAPWLIIRRASRLGIRPCRWRPKAYHGPRVASGLGQRCCPGRRKTGSRG